MKVIICGAGQVGYNIAMRLVAEHNDVTIIDRSPELIRRVSDNLDVQGLVGYASHPGLLERAGAADAEMIIAVTYMDEVNMVACQVAHALFNVPTKVARVRAQNYLDPKWHDLFTRDNMPIDVIISPEIEVARAVLRRLEVPGAFDIIPFADGLVRVVGAHLTESCPVLNTPLRQLTELFPDLNAVIVGIIRDGKLHVPSGDDQLFVGDDIYFCVEQSHVARSLTILGHEEREARRVIIVGGGNVGLFLATELDAHYPGVHAKLIELDGARANDVADRLPKTVVLHGNALEQEILAEANASQSETVIAVTDDDQVNILASLLAKRAGCQRAVALINNPGFGPLMTSLGIDVFIDPRATTVSSILQHVRRGRIRALHSLLNGQAEVIEAEALETSSLVGKPLREIRLGEGMIVGAIVRDGEVVIPRGDTIVRAKDRVVMFATADAVKKVEQIFTVRLEFF
jgi:trk/ktr system potassium uptake protein